MPNLTISLTTAQVTRIRDAFGPGTTQLDVENWLKDQLKSKVRDVESSIMANSKHDEVTAEVW